MPATCAAQPGPECTRRSFTPPRHPRPSVDPPEIEQKARARLHGLPVTRLTEGEEEEEEKEDYTLRLVAIIV